MLRETATVVSASLLFNVISGGAFAAVRTLWPGVTPDMGMFIRAPLPYFQEHYASVLLWAGAVFAVSVGLAALWGVPPRWSHTLVEMVANLTPRWQGPLRDWSARRRNRIIFKSDWSYAFEDHPGHCVYVGLRLQDGTYLYGPLMAFNPRFEENNERGLILGRPIRIRTPSAEDLEDYDADALVVSAGHIKTVSVHRIPESELPAKSELATANLTMPGDTLDI